MTPEEQITRLQKRVRNLCIAFENIEAERKYLRKHMEAIRELSFKIAELTNPYEGQDNVKEPSGPVLVVPEIESIV